MNEIIRGSHNYYLKICDIPANRLTDTKLDFPVYGVSDPEDPVPNTVIFVKNNFTPDKNLKNCIITATNRVDADDSCVQVITGKPKNEYGALLKRIDTELDAGREFNNINSSFVSVDAKIGENTSIGRFCRISYDVTIGKNCKIGDYVSIGPHTVIGDNVRIDEKASIGIDDADIYREHNQCLVLKHLGGAIIGDGCFLMTGANMAAGSTKATVLGRSSMLGTYAILGHNCIVGQNVLIGAHSDVCGHCVIGDDCYIAPGATLINRIKIGKRASVGISSVVLNDVDENISVFGNPAMTYFKKNN